MIITTLLDILQGHKTAVTCVKFSSNDAHVASSSANGEVLLHSLITGQIAGSFVTNDQQVT